MARDLNQSRAMTTTIDPFWTSVSGRLATATGGFATVAAGVLALLGPAETPVWAVPAVLLVCIVGFLFAVGFSLGEHGRWALVMVLALPFLAGPYQAALIFAPLAGTIPGVLLIGLGIAAFARVLWRAERPSFSRPATA